MDTIIKFLKTAGKWIIGMVTINRRVTALEKKLETLDIPDKPEVPFEDLFSSRCVEMDSIRHGGIQRDVKANRLVCVICSLNKKDFVYIHENELGFECPEHGFICSYNEG